MSHVPMDTAAMALLDTISQAVTPRQRAEAVAHYTQVQAMHSTHRIRPDLQYTVVRCDAIRADVEVGYSTDTDEDAWGNVEFIDGAEEIWLGGVNIIEGLAEEVRDQINDALNADDDSALIAGMDRAEQRAIDRELSL